MGNGIVTEGATVLNLTFGFTPKFLIVFNPLETMDGAFGFSYNSNSIKFMGGNMTSMATYESGATSYIDYNTFSGKLGFPNFFMWHQGMSSCWMYSYAQRSGSTSSTTIIDFALSDNTLTAKTKRHVPNYGATNYYEPKPFYVFNYSGWTYNWIAFG